MPLTLFHLALLERENGNLEAAIDALRKAIAIVPDNAETVAMLGASLTQAGRPAEAVELLDPFARREHADLEVLTARALALAKLRRFDEALASLSRARSRGPVQRTAAPRGGHGPSHGRTTRPRAGGLESGARAESESRARPHLARRPEPRRATSRRSDRTLEGRDSPRSTRVPHDTRHRRCRSRKLGKRPRQGRRSTFSWRMRRRRGLPASSSEPAPCSRRCARRSGRFRCRALESDCRVYSRV